MASSPITSWQIEGGKVEAMADFIFLGSKITVDVDYSHGINEMTLATWNETYYKLGSILKSRGITLLTKFCIVKAMVSPVVMYGCEGSTIKKAEYGTINAFELWHLEKTARRSNQSLLKKINPEYSLEGLMLKLVLAT